MRRQEFNFLLQLFVLVVVFGGYAILSISTPLPDEKRVQPNIALPENDDSILKDERQPASVASLASSTALAVSKSIVTSVKWNCQFDGGETINTASLQLRLKGYCPESQSLTIHNATNGFTASVFTNDKNEYSTDYIQLSEGENILKIKTLNKKGESEEKSFTVVHTPANAD